MKTLYDLLGARPDDDAEGLRNAFRKAAKANHPDLHAGDPDAPIRFRRIVEAYDILRDAEQRAAYDRMVQFEREQLRWKLRRTISYLMHSIVSDAIAVAGLAIVLGGGYTLFAYLSKTPNHAAKQIEATGGWSAQIAALQPAARADATGPKGLRDKPEHVAAPAMSIVLGALESDRIDGGAAEVAKVWFAPSSTGLSTGAAKPYRAFDLRLHDAEAKSDADRFQKNDRVGSPGQEREKSVEVQPSAPEKDNGAAKSALSDVAALDDKHDMKTPDTPDVSTGDTKIFDMKVRETKVPGRPRTVAKRPATSHATFEQASLENRSASACSGPCSNNTPPLFGVGF